MQNGSPTDPAPSSTETEVTDPAASPEAPSGEPTEQQLDEVTEAGRTPEEIEAIWRNRVAGKDRAHAAETATLRAQLEQEKQQREALERERSAREAGDLSEADQWKQKAQAAEERAANLERQRVVDVRSVKYAAAAEHLDESTLAAMDEAKLAALNARLTGDESPPPVIDPNTPRRPTTVAPPRDKGIEELESDLKKYEPEFKASLGG